MAVNYYNSSDILRNGDMFSVLVGQAGGGRAPYSAAYSTNGTSVRGMRGKCLVLRRNANMLLSVLSKSTVSSRVPKAYLRETDLSYFVCGPVAIEEGRYTQYQLHTPW